DEPLLEIPQDVLEHVHVLAHRRLHSQCFHEQLPIPLGEFLGTVQMSLTDQPSEHFALLWVMGQQKIFVDCVELHQGLPRDSILHEILPTTVTEDPFDKILPERRLSEPPSFPDRNQREQLDKGPGEQSDSVPAGHAMLIVDADSFDTAARRTLLKDVPG